MNVKVTGNKIQINHTLLKNEIYRIAKGSKFQSLTIMAKPQVVNGFSNITEDNYGILLADYDNTDKSVVLEDYSHLQAKFLLPPAYLLKTKENNFHIVCVAKFPHSKIPEILAYTRCDSNYKDMILRSPFRSYVLRISSKKGSKKPEFVEVIGETKNLDVPVSSAHLKLIEKLHKVPKINYTNLDGLNGIKLQSYETGGV